MGSATVTLALLWAPLSHAHPPQLPAQALAGDLIFRTGTATVSHAVLAMDDGKFSHVGLLTGGPGQWQVVHATPAERPQAPDAVVLDTLDFYLDPQRASGFEVFHLPAATAAQRAQAVDWALQQVGRPFDMLDRTQGTYCTTLVWEAWQQAGLTLDVRFTTLRLPLLSGSYLLPSALAAAPQLRALGATPALQKNLHHASF